jgi:hypothetical protein
MRARTIVAVIENSRFRHREEELCDKKPLKQMRIWTNTSSFSPFQRC